MSKLYIGNLNYEITENELKEIFEKVGVVNTITIIKDKFSGRSKGFGFIEMGSRDDAQKAITELNGKEVQGRKITVAEAYPQQPRRGGRFNRDRFNRKFSK